MWTNLQKTVGLLTFTKEIISGKLLVLCSVYSVKQPFKTDFNALSANPTKWSDILKQFVGCCRKMWKMFFFVLASMLWIILPIKVRIKYSKIGQIQENKFKFWSSNVWILFTVKLYFENENVVFMFMLRIFLFLGKLLFSSQQTITSSKSRIETLEKSEICSKLIIKAPGFVCYIIFKQKTLLNLGCYIFLRFFSTKFY